MEYRGGARIRALAVVGVATSFVPIALGAAAPAAALVTEPVEPNGFVVSARITSAADPVRSGDRVTVELTLANEGESAHRVLLDEVIGDVLDDATLVGSPRSSGADVTVMRLGYDRIALMGWLESGEQTTLAYDVEVRPAAERGDGVLARAVVRADEASACGEHASAPPAATGVGSCAALVIPGAMVPAPASTTDASAAEDASALADPAGAGGALAASGSAAGDDLGSLVASRPVEVLVAALVVAAVLIAGAVLVSLVRRSRRRGPQRPRPDLRPVDRGMSGSPRRPATVAETARRIDSPELTIVARTTPERPPAPPHFDSRRERRLAERRLAERGLALPVA